MNILRSVALMLGICTCGAAQAQYGGQTSAPAAPAGNAYPNTGYGGSPYSTSGYAANGVAPAQQVNTLGSGFAAYPGSAAAAAQTARQVPSTQSWAQLSQPQFPGGSYRTVANDQPLTDGQSVGSGAAADNLPAPPQMPADQEPIHQGGKVHLPAPHVEGAGGDCTDCNVGHVYHEAAAAPWVGSAPVAAYGPGPLLPVRNWFAGSSLLFFDFEDECSRRLVFSDAMPDETILESGQVAPGSDVGFETFIGRYFAGGKYAITGSYFYFNPDQASLTAPAPAAGDYRSTMRNWDRLYIDLDSDGVADDFGTFGDGTDDHMAQLFDDTAAYRIRRDVEFQGIELNFVSFGIGGAMRAASADCGSCATAGCGGMCGPLLPACNSRVQMQVSHGLRWFQFRDEFELGTTTIANGYGSGPDDFYYNVDTENNLFGYQFGGRANYCLHRRVNLYAGGKIGVYGNDVDYSSRLGTRDVVAQVGAYYPGNQGEAMDVSRSDTVLASLGELDLGMGVRLTQCWSLTGGYRMLGVTGVATSVGAISDDAANLNDGHLTCVNDSILLHGGYVGVQYNW